MSNALQLYPSISALSQALAKHQLSATELTQDCLNHIAEQSALNAFVHVDTELTLAQARQADAILAAGTGNILTGLPIAHKDVFVTQGWRSTAGSNMLKHYTSPFDATVVHQLRVAGCVTLGKLNCDEFAMGSGNKHSTFGPTHNPWDTSVVPGGSSGASAAAVAAKLVIAATGTDTGGSVRQPAALCGVSGIKPTYGAVSRYGMIAYGSSLDQAGPLASSALDLVDLLDVMSGFDNKDSTSAEYCKGVPNAPGRIRAEFNRAEASFNSSASQPLKGLRIGVPKEFFGQVSRTMSPKRSKPRCSNLKKWVLSVSIFPCHAQSCPFPRIT